MAGELLSPLFAQIVKDLHARVGTLGPQAEEERKALYEEAARRRAAESGALDTLDAMIRDMPTPKLLPITPERSALSTLGPLLSGHVAALLLRRPEVATNVDTTLQGEQAQRVKELVANTALSNEDMRDRSRMRMEVQMKRFDRLAEHADSIGAIEDAAKYSEKAHKLAEAMQQEAQMAGMAALQGSEGMRTKYTADQALLGHLLTALHSGKTTVLSPADYSKAIEQTLNDFKDKNGKISDDALPAIRTAIAMFHQEGMTQAQWLNFLANISTQNKGLISSGKKLFDFNDADQQRLLNSISDLHPWGTDTTPATPPAVTTPAHESSPSPEHPLLKEAQKEADKIFKDFFPAPTGRRKTHTPSGAKY